MGAAHCQPLESRLGATLFCFLACIPSWLRSVFQQAFRILLSFYQIGFATSLWAPGHHHPCPLYLHHSPPCLYLAPQHSVLTCFGSTLETRLSGPRTIRRYTFDGFAPLLVASDFRSIASLTAPFCLSSALDPVIRRLVYEFSTVIRDGHYNDGHIHSRLYSA